MNEHDRMMIRSLSTQVCGLLQTYTAVCFYTDGVDGAVWVFGECIIGRKLCVVPIGIGRGSSSRDRRRRPLTHTHRALYRLTPFLTYLALAPTVCLLHFLIPPPPSTLSPPSLHLANSHFSPSLADSSRLCTRVSLTHVLLLLLFSLRYRLGTGPQIGQI